MCDAAVGAAPEGGARAALAGAAHVVAAAHGAMFRELLGGAP